MVDGWWRRLLDSTCDYSHCSAPTDWGWRVGGVVLHTGLSPRLSHSPHCHTKDTEHCSVPTVALLIICPAVKMYDKYIEIHASVVLTQTGSNSPASEIVISTPLNKRQGHCLPSLLYSTDTHISGQNEWSRLRTMQLWLPGWYMCVDVEMCCVSCPTRGVGVG